MLRSSKPFFALSILICFAGQFAAAQTLHLTQRTIHDSGFGRRMASHTVLAPSNWKVEGSGFWADSKYYKIVPSQEITLSSGNGYGIEIGPIINASDGRITQAGAAAGFTIPQEFEAESGRLVLYRPDTLEEWSEFYLKHLMPNLKTGSDGELIETFEIQDLTAVIEQQLGSTRQNLESANKIYRNSNFEQSCDGVAIGFRTRYQVSGHEMEALHVLLLSTIYTHTANYVRLDWDCVRDVRLTARRGQLEEALPEMVAIACSVRETDEWAREKIRHVAKISNTELQGFAERSKIWADNHREISNIIASSQRRRDASNDRSHRNFVNAIRDVEIYSDGGTNYELPSGFDRVFSDGGGNFIMTNDQLLDPNVDLSTSSSWSAVNPQR